MQRTEIMLNCSYLPVQVSIQVYKLSTETETLFDNNNKPTNILAATYIISFIRIHKDLICIFPVNCQHDENILITSEFCELLAAFCPLFGLHTQNYSCITFVVFKPGNQSRHWYSDSTTPWVIWHIQSSSYVVNYILIQFLMYTVELQTY